MSRVPEDISKFAKFANYAYEFTSRDKDDFFINDPWHLDRELTSLLDVNNEGFVMVNDDSGQVVFSLKGTELTYRYARYDDYKIFFTNDPFERARYQNVLYQIIKKYRQGKSKNKVNYDIILTGHSLGASKLYQLLDKQTPDGDYFAKYISDAYLYNIGKSPIGKAQSAIIEEGYKPEDYYDTLFNFEMCTKDPKLCERLKKHVRLIRIKGDIVSAGSYYINANRISTIIPIQSAYYLSTGHSITEFINEYREQYAEQLEKELDIDKMTFNEKYERYLQLSQQNLDSERQLLDQSTNPIKDIQLIEHEQKIIKDNNIIIQALANSLMSDQSTYITEKERKDLLKFNKIAEDAYNTQKKAILDDKALAEADVKSGKQALKDNEAEQKKYKVGSQDFKVNAQQISKIKGQISKNEAIIKADNDALKQLDKEYKEEKYTFIDEKDQNKYAKILSLVGKSEKEFEKKQLKEHQIPEEELYVDEKASFLGPRQKNVQREKELKEIKENIETQKKQVEHFIKNVKPQISPLYNPIQEVSPVGMSQEQIQMNRAGIKVINAEFIPVPPALNVQPAYTLPPGMQRGTSFEDIQLRPQAGSLTDQMIKQTEQQKQFEAKQQIEQQVKQQTQQQAGINIIGANNIMSDFYKGKRFEDLGRVSKAPTVKKEIISRTGKKGAEGSLLEEEQRKTITEASKDISKLDKIPVKFDKTPQRAINPKIGKNLPKAKLKPEKPTKELIKKETAKPKKLSPPKEHKDKTLKEPKEPSSMKRLTAPQKIVVPKEEKETFKIKNNNIQ
jgi:hypothetical protein